MQIHRDWTGLPATARGATVAMGNFDGVHRGHQAVIEAARSAAEAPLGVITFEPHPREYFAPDAPSFRLIMPIRGPAGWPGWGSSICMSCLSAR